MTPPATTSPATVRRRRLAPAVRVAALAPLALSLAGCFTIEQGFRYDYDGRVYRADGVTPVKDADVRVVPPNRHKLDKTPRTKTDGRGRFAGTIQTHKGWQYTEGPFAGADRKPPHPPALGHVVVQVQEKDAKWVGYELPLGPESQTESRAGVRKLHLPDLLLPDPPTTKPATTTQTTTTTTRPATPTPPRGGG